MGNINWLLVAVSAVFVLFIIRGYNRGFLKMAVTLAALIFAVFVATRLMPDTNEFLTKNTIIYNFVYEKTAEFFHDTNSQYNDKSREEQNEVIEEYDLPSLIISDLIIKNTDEIYESLKVHIFEDYIAKYITLLVIKSGTFIILSLITVIIIWVVFKITGLMAKIPIIRGLNRYLGMLAGAALALILVWVFFFVLVVFFRNTAAGTLLADVRESRILSFIYDSNILFKMNI
ncbi:MAG: CvpA family protein [Lachnospiraceae bacterium]|nr:CvpA family protein [Lachnospiraceae bacterium]